MVLLVLVAMLLLVVVSVKVVVIVVVVVLQHFIVYERCNCFELVWFGFLLPL